MNPENSDSWAPGERGRVWLLAAIALSAVFYPLRQHWRPVEQRTDGFPLSYYPMFSALRAQTSRVNYVVGVHADGSRHYLPYRLLGPGGLNQVRRQLKRVIAAERADELAESLAATVATEPGFEDVTRVEIVEGEFDLDVCLLDHRVAGTETVHAVSDVSRLLTVEVIRPEASPDVTPRQVRV